MIEWNVFPDGEKVVYLSMALEAIRSIEHRSSETVLIEMTVILKKKTNQHLRKWSLIVSSLKKMGESVPHLSRSRAVCGL